jgi:hypothetical protein
VSCAQLTRGQALLGGDKGNVELVSMLLLRPEGQRRAEAHQMYHVSMCMFADERA